MLPAGLGILAALAFVLGLIALAVWALKRVGGGSLTGRSRLPVEVVQRLPLGPKAGLAVVRVGEKVLAVSMGEGGVHTLFEVDEADRRRIIAGSEVPVPVASSAAARSAFAGALTPFRPFGRALSEALANTPADDAPGMPAAVAAMASPTAATAETTVPAPAPAAVTRAEPSRPRDLQSVLSMTLAPSTRLLSIAAFVALGLFGSAGSLAAQAAQAAPPAAATAAPAGTTQAAPQPAAPSIAETVGSVVPQLDLRLGSGPEGELRLNGTVGVVLMMGLLTLVPTLLLMMTGFTRILIVLHFLKQAMGTQSAPPAHLVAGLALLLTAFVMAPTVSEANRTAIAPWLEGRMEQKEMLQEGVKPFREFMLRQTNEKDLRTFIEMSRIEQPETPDDVPLHVLMSAFVASELRTAFQIGFAIYLPFIVIDAVVASVLMAMGMFMLPPAMISLPFKLLLFVLVDGWSLTIQSLVQSFR